MTPLLGLLSLVVMCNLITEGMMLVLTRRWNERINVTLKTGETIVVTVCHIAGGSAKLGIDAPPAVEIVRVEIIGRDAPQ